MSKNPLNLTDHDFNGLIQIGFLAQVLGPLHNLTMKDTATALLGSNVNLTELLGPALRAGGSDVNPRIPLTGLTVVLDLVAHDNSSFNNVLAYVVVTSITLAMFILRMYSRKYVTKRIRPEDWAMAGAMAVALALGACFALGSDDRVGRGTYHIWDLTFDQFRSYLIWLYVCQIIYPIALFFVRNSLLIFYWCLTPSSSVVFRRFVMGFFAVNVACVSVSLGTIIFQCSPINYWDNPVTAVCIDRVASFIAGGILIIVTDVLILILPIPLVVNLQIPRREKYIVLGMFAIGSLACIASINRVIRAKDVTDSTSADVTYVNAHNSSGIWSLLEVDLAIIASCAPAIKAIWMRQAMPMFASKTTSAVSSQASNPKRANPKKSMRVEEDSVELTSSTYTSSTVTYIDVEATQRDSKDYDLEASRPGSNESKEDPEEDFTHFSRPLPAYRVSTAHQL